MRWVVLSLLVLAAFAPSAAATCHENGPWNCPMAPMDPEVLKQLGVHKSAGGFDVWAAAHLGSQNPAGNATLAAVPTPGPFVVQIRLEGDLEVPYDIAWGALPPGVVAEVVPGGTHNGATDIVVRMFAEDPQNGVYDFGLEVTVGGQPVQVQVPVTLTSPTNFTPGLSLVPLVGSLALAAWLRRP